MTTTAQNSRVEDDLRLLHELEHERRQYAASGPTPNHDRHNQLANLIRQLIEEMPAGDLRSFTTRLVVHSLNGDLWPRCAGCGRPTYIGEANRAPKQ